MNKTKPMFLSEKMTNDFTDIIYAMLQRSTCVGNYENSQGLDNFLLLDLADDESLMIGCREGGNFLLDCDLIYQQFCQYWRMTQEVNGIIPSQKEFYECLYRQKIIIPYGLHFRRPLYSICIEKSRGRRMYFCISNEMIGIDTSEIMQV